MVMGMGKLVAGRGQQSRTLFGGVFMGCGVVVVRFWSCDGAEVVDVFPLHHFSLLGPFFHFNRVHFR